MLNRPAIALFNHLLAQSGWALPRLAGFAGCSLSLAIFPFEMKCTIQPDGSLAEAEPDAMAEAAFTLPPSLLPRFALNDQTALDAVAHSGDTALVEEIFFIARHLRWDAAEDLSAITGDIAAERLVGLAQVVQQQFRKNALSLAEAATEYWTEERPLIASAHLLARFAAQVSSLDQGIAALEARLQRLTKEG